MEDYKKKLGSLAEKIKNQPTVTPIQKVQPIGQFSALDEEKEARFNNWIPKDLKKKVKAYGVQNDISQKDITIQALEDFLKRKEL